jgi:hypothetical protein
VTKSKEVVSWKERAAKDAQDVAKVERPQLGAIGTRGGFLSYGGSEVKGNKLDVVVIGYTFENNYYKERFDPNNPRNPDCFAFGVARDGEEPIMVPHSSIESPMHDVCIGCAMAEWGSTPTGGRGKACKEIRKLAVLPVSALTSPEAVAKAELAVLKVPVTSVRNWKTYVNLIAASHQLPPYAMITTVAPRPHPKNQFEITFEAVGTVADDYMDAIVARIDAVYNVLTQPYDRNVEAPKQEDSKKF